MARLQKKGNPLTLLVGMQTGAATLENSTEVPQKVRNRRPHSPAIALLSIHPKKTKILIQRDTCTSMFRAALSPIAKLWKEPKCPQTDEWIKKTWYIYTTGYYSTTKKTEILSFATTWMELECIMLSETSQSEKEKYSTCFHSYVELKKQEMNIWEGEEEKKGKQTTRETLNKNRTN